VGIPPSYLLFVDDKMKNAEGMPLKNELTTLKPALFRLRSEDISSKWKIVNRIFAMARIVV
jgi:hypothetical protein